MQSAAKHLENTEDHCERGDGGEDEVEEKMEKRSRGRRNAAIRDGGCNGDGDGSGTMGHVTMAGYDISVRGSVELCSRLLVGTTVSKDQCERG